MRRLHSRRHRGIALIALLAILALGALGFLIRQLNAESGGIDAVRKNRNAEVLNRAKQALIGYVAQQAVQATENNPGRLPCPEAPGNFGDPANEGTAAGNCSLPSVGRLPWRTLGLDKLVDAAGEPLWYVVSTGWALSNSTSPPLTTYINSNSVGQLTVNGTANDSVALIIAPGPAFSVAAAAGCTAWNQIRPTTGTPDWRNYLECENATSPPDASFVTTGPSGSFKDQVIRVTAADILPAIEAVIAKRIERDIVPALKSLYADASWSTSSSNPVFPHAASFVDPSTSTFLGSSGVAQGLLPAFTAATDPTRVVWYRNWETYPPSAGKIGGTGSLSGAPDCSATSTTTVSCSVTYTGEVRIQVTAATRRVARTMRQLNAAAIPLGWADTFNPSLSVNAAFISSSTSGAAYIYVQANLPNSVLETTTTVTVPIGVLADHSLTDPNNPTTGWFVRNNWHHVLYYAFAPNFAANQTRFCNPPPDAEPCLSVANVAPPGQQRAILILAGQSINGSARPSTMLADYLEFGNATAAFERRTISASNAIAPAQRFNDRIVVIDSN
jgi:hypothetical protein